MHELSTRMIISAILLSFNLSWAQDVPVKNWAVKYVASDTAAMPMIAEEPLTLFTVADPGIRGIFSRDMRLQGYLDVEGALALAEADVDVVPREAARQIAANANLSLINRTLLLELAKIENHPLMPLIGAFTDVLNSKDNVTLAGAWVHWGATTQNIVMTGFTLGVRRAFAILLQLLADLLGSLSRLASRTAEVVMPGRTHGQQAVPITFGFKVAGYLDELGRHVDRLLAAQPRLLTAVVGGAVGSMASFGSPFNNSVTKGPEIEAGVATRLGLGTFGVPTRTALDHFVELVLDLSMLGATCARMATEVFELMQTEFGEAEEPVPKGTIGSSTMPQKRNPNVVEDSLLIEGQLRGLVGPALQSMVSTHEAQGDRPRLVSYTVIEAVGLMGDLLANLNFTLGDGFTIYEEGMWHNVNDLSRGLLMSERVMLALGEKIGRQPAHELVYNAAMKTFKTPGARLNDTLWEDPTVRRQLGNRGQLEHLMNPAGYTGESANLARQQASAGFAKVEVLRRAADVLSKCDGLWNLVRKSEACGSGIPSTTVRNLEQQCAAMFLPQKAYPPIFA